jgi:hypothetical protein
MHSARVFFIFVDLLPENSLIPKFNYNSSIKTLGLTEIGVTSFTTSLLCILTLRHYTSHISSTNVFVVNSFVDSQLAMNVA